MASVQDLYDTAYDLLCDGETDRAIRTYKEILDVSPDHADAVHDLAHAYADKGSLDDAISMAVRLTELRSEDELSFTVLSRFYQQKGMIPEAEAAANSARMLAWKQQLREQKGQP